MSRSADSSATLADVSDLPVTTILESIPDAVVVAEFATDRVVAANGAAGDLFGYRTDDLVGLDRRTLHPAGRSDAYEEAFARAFESEQVDRLRDGSPVYIETAGGDHVPVEINAQRIDSGGRALVLGVFRDISDRIERERRLRETTTRLETLLDATPLPVAVLDTAGRIQVWNRAAEETFGYDTGDVLGEQYPLFVDDGHLERLLAAVLDGQVLDGHEADHRAKDGSRMNVEIHARPLYEGGEITGLVGSAIDVTDRKRRSQRLDVLHRLLRHNLRNRVSVIQGYASALSAESRPDAGDVHEAVDRILSAGDDLAELSRQVTQTRNLVRVAPNGTGAVAVTDLLTTVAGVASSAPEATVEVSVPADRAAVPPETREPLSWLLSHVVDYTADPALELSAAVRDRHVRVDIDGPTPLLSSGHRELIANGEETALKHGNDLDVARSYLTLTSLGGDVSLAGESDSGRSVRVEIPRADAGEAD